MKRIFLTLAIALCAGVHPVLAVQETHGAGAMTGGRDIASRPMARPVRHKGPRRCRPVARDFYWLDFSRMGMGMQRTPGNDAHSTAGGQGARLVVNRRMRILRLRHDGFPPRNGGGCPTCGARNHKAMDKRAHPSLERRAMRRNRRQGKADALLGRAAIWLETPDNLIHRIDPKKPGIMRFNARMWGLHRIFAFLDSETGDGLRRRYFAFYDMFSHGDEVSKKDRPMIEGNGYWKGEPEFFLRRLYENDRARFSARTGETVRFRLTLRGKPVKGACLVMITQKDWRKTAVTDEKGEAAFFLIKESPTPSTWRGRRRAEKYLLIASHMEPPGKAHAENGTAVRYVATAMLRVRPSRREWESKSTAFILGSFTIVAAGAAIAIRRSRRRRKRTA